MKICPIKSQAKQLIFFVIFLRLRNCNLRSPVDRDSQFWNDDSGRVFKSSSEMITRVCNALYFMV